jgi:hypothetical protein
MIFCFSASQSSRVALSRFPMATVPKHDLVTKIRNETATVQHMATAEPDEPSSGK